MCIDLEGHHSGGSSIVNAKDFCYYRNYVCIITGTSSALRKNRSESPNNSTVSHPGLGSDPPIGSDWGLGCDMPR